MWCGSSSELLFACILKHMKYYFGGFLVNDHLHRVAANGLFLFIYLNFFLFFVN